MKFLRLEKPLFDTPVTLEEKIALTFYDNVETPHETTYKELKRFSQEIDSILTAHGSSEIVGIHCHSGPSAIVCMFGSLKNNSFIYLDPYLKDTELLDLIYRVPVSLAITHHSLLGTLKSLMNNLVILQEFTLFSHSFSLVRFCFVNPQSTAINNHFTNEAIAYVMSTSGSTGFPKLVYVPHNCIVPNIEDFGEIFHVSKSDTILNLSPLYFDPCIVDIFLSLNFGAHLVMLAPHLVRRPKYLQTIIQNNQISIIQITPTLMGMLDSSFLRDYFLSSNSPKIIAFGGEAFPSQAQCSEWFTPSCNIKVFNLYGLTEVSCWASCYKVDMNEYLSNSKLETKLSVPIGKSLTKTILYLADDSGNKLKEGIGNIVISGERNSCIIVENQITHESSSKPIITGDIGFSDGSQIFFIKRVSDTVKRNGCKVGLYEIECASKLLPGISQCCAVFHEQGIYLFITLSCRSSLTEETVFGHLKTKLSSWKMPNRIYILDELPCNRNGKIDKILLTKHFKQTHRITPIDSVVSETHSEIMDRLWKEYLGICNPKESDTFLNLGGNSIIAVELAEKICNVYNIDNPLILQTLLNNTFNDLCSFVNECLNSSPKMKPVNSPTKKIKLETKNEICHNTSRRHKTISTAFVSRTGYYRNNELTIISIPPIKELKLTWKISLDKCIDSSPLLVESNDKIRLYIGSHSSKFMCLDETGLNLWTSCLPDRIEASAVLSCDGQNVYVCCYDCSLYCLNSDNGEIVWRVQTDGVIKSSPIIDTNTGCLVFGSYDQCLYCCSFKGDIIWKERLTKGSIYSSPVIIENSVYAATLDGFLVCLNIRDGKQQWKKSIGKPIFSSLAVAAGRIVFGCTDGYVYCSDYSGKILWKYKTNAPIFSSPFIVEYKCDTLIAIGSHDHHVYLFNREGRVITSIKFSSPIFSTPFLLLKEGGSCCYVITCETKGELRITEVCIDSHHSLQSTLICKHRMAGEIFSSPIVYDKCIYVGCRDNNLCCLTAM